MEKLRVFEAFAGVGSQRMALRNLGIDHEVVAIAEIDKFALKSYEAIHGDCPNLGDISKLPIDEIPDHDLFTYSFPCQDISIAGNMNGFSEGSGTRSSLLWECRRVIEGKQPKYLLLENVKNLVGKKNREDFEKWLDWLSSKGYTNHWQILNAKDYIPQNRERVFVVSILGDENYDFPIPEPNTFKLKDLLESDVDEKYFLSEELQSRFIYKEQGENVIGLINKEGWTDQLKRVYKIDSISPTLSTMQGGHREPKILVEGNLNIPQWIEQSRRIYNSEGLCPTIPARAGGMDITPKILIKNATKQGYLEATNGDGIDLNYPDSETRRGRVQTQRSHTLTTSGEYGVLCGYRIRKLMPNECWRLMGFTDEDFAKAKASGVSDSQLYKQAGNSIVVPVLEAIFRNLFLKEAK